MNSVLSSSRTLLLAAIMAGVFAAPWPVTAQQAPVEPGTRRRSGIARDGANPNAAAVMDAGRAQLGRGVSSRAASAAADSRPPPTSCRWRS